MTVNICFVSGHYFGYNALKGILESNEYLEGKINVSNIISLKHVKKDKTVGYFDFAYISKKYNIPHHTISSLKTPESINFIQNCDPDYLLIIGWSELAPSQILDIPKKIKNSNEKHASDYGCIGMHPTLLPEGRGRAPIPWTIIKGMKETGVTAFLLEETADSGGIILQERITIADRETATSLFDKCANAHLLLATKLSFILANKSLNWTEQHIQKVSVWTKRTPEDGIINFNESIIFIDRFIRALMPPYPGAFFYYDKKRNVVNKFSINKNQHSEEIGKIVNISSKGLPSISARDGILDCLEIQCDGSLPDFRVGIKID